MPETSWEYIAWVIDGYNKREREETRKIGYTTVSTTVEGAAESDEYFYDNIPEDQIKMKNSIKATQDFAHDNSDMSVQIFKLHHPHEMMQECMCVQMLNDHHPYWSSK